MFQKCNHIHKKTYRSYSDRGNSLILSDSGYKRTIPLFLTRRILRHGVHILLIEVMESEF